MRAISSVVDVAVFLLLVSAAVGTLTLAHDGGGERVTVDDRANLLATSTADIEYGLGGADRRAHGTVAWLLGRAAVANAAIDGTELSTRHAGYERRVRNATRRMLGPANRTTVVVRWDPYRGAPVDGTLRVGARPPAGADVTVATVTVPSPAPSVGATEVRREGGGFDGVGTAAARATVRALLPESRAAIPTRTEAPATVVTATRFRTLAAATGTDVDGPLARGNVSLARHRLVAGLADRFERDMRERFASPDEAARAIRVGTVRLTLRRWEA